jgi:hypothetical protein
MMFLLSNQAVPPEQLRPQIRRPKSTGLRYHVNPRPGSTLYHGFGQAGFQPPKNLQGTRLDCDHLGFEGFTAGDQQGPGRIDRSLKLGYFE